MICQAFIAACIAVLICGCSSCPSNVQANATKAEAYSATSATGQGNANENLERQYLLEQERWGDFLEKVASGDGTAVALAAKFIKISDGGNLEDLYKALASSAHVSLYQLLDVIKENDYSEITCSILFLSVPEEFVDNFTARRKELQWRLDLLEKNRDRLAAAGCQGVIDVLRQRLKDLDR